MALFLLARAALTYLLTALSVALKPLFPFQQAQCVQVFPLKPPPFCTLYADLGSTNKPATFLLFSSYLTLSPRYFVLFSVLSFTSKLTSRFVRNCLLSPPVLSGYNGSPDTGFSRGTTRPMSWPDGESYSCLLQFCVVSLLLSLVSTFLGLEACCLSLFCIPPAVCDRRYFD